ncbi:lipase family protein [Paenibacillus arenilitoris]|uniref:Lipase family protein n=1 Tax=Paenibacillus arenilitoris TaxID=2772299 RepID=A0A927CQL1_9BACL|nr:lipase family protein [Paenibacillus arenilitoris]MBD2872354.1 lipase family protein [Paenibacillus arenilitoris]
MGTTLHNRQGPQELDLRTALFLAAVCGQTYMQFNNKDGLFLVPKPYRLASGFTAKAYDDSEERFGFALTSDRASVLAFRGSGSAVDWVSDFIAQQTTYRPVKNAGLTHKGFTDIYMSARGQIMNIAKQLPGDKPLFVTGHSLGGALATLAALDLASNSAFKEPIVYTFGAPRVGDPKFVTAYNGTVGTHWRFQNEFDIVPHLPTLVYQSPDTNQTYYYMHVKGEVKRSFRMGSIAGNHLLSSYFADLAREEPAFAMSVCAEPPGWCPADEAQA